MAWEQDENWGIGPSCAPAWIPGNSYTFVWAGNELEAKLDGSGNVLQKYTWGPIETGQNQVLAITDFTMDAPVTYALTYDASGNVTQMLNAETGALVASYSYSPYGQQMSATGPLVSLNPFGFKGYWTDQALPGGPQWAQPDEANQTVRQTDPIAGGIWMEDDPTGISGGVNDHEPFGDDPIDNGDANGTSYYMLQAIHADAVASDKGAAVPGEVSRGGNKYGRPSGQQRRIPSYGKRVGRLCS